MRGLGCRTPEATVFSTKSNGNDCILVTARLYQDIEAFLDRHDQLYGHPTKFSGLLRKLHVNISLCSLTISLSRVEEWHCFE